MPFTIETETLLDTAMKDNTTGKWIHLCDFSPGVAGGGGKEILAFLICHVIKLVCHRDTAAVLGWQICLRNSRL